MPDTISCSGVDRGLSTTPLPESKKLTISSVWRPAVSDGSGAEQEKLSLPEGEQLNPSSTRRWPSTYAANWSAAMSPGLTEPWTQPTRSRPVTDSTEPEGGGDDEGGESPLQPATTAAKSTSRGASRRRMGGNDNVGGPSADWP